jgi:CubicO group peptidase (beta-lactamase class C family)
MNEGSLSQPSSNIRLDRIPTLMWSNGQNSPLSRWSGMPSQRVSLSIRKDWCFSMRATIPAILVCLTSALPAHAQPGERRFVERLEPFLEKTLREQKIPGLAVGIVEAGRQVYIRGFGVMDSRDPSRPVTAETLFHMASITKPFVATSVMQLVEQGKVDLDAPITRYLPYFRLKDPRYRSITVRLMLTHTSGMPDVEDYLWDKPEFDDGALERYVRSLEDRLLLWEPGTKFAYSNMAYEVLGDLVAKVSGMSFENYVGENILKPLGMRSSTLLLKEAAPAKLAVGHTRAKDGAVIPVVHYPYNRSHTPSSNLHSSAMDMVRWMLVNLNRGELDGHRILKNSTYDLMWTPTVTSKKERVGISWFLSNYKGQQIVKHGGQDVGFLTTVVLLPARKTGVVVLVNSDRAPIGAIERKAMLVALGEE